MRRTSPKVGITLLLIIAACDVLGQSALPASSSASSETSQELQVIKAQIQTTKDYQEQFLSVVEWSLSAVLAMALGLAAFNWYTSKITYERDIQSLHQENKSLHAELTALLKTETEAAAKLLNDQMSNRQAEIQAAIETLLDQKLSKHASALDNLKYELLDLKFQHIKGEAKRAITEKQFGWAIYKYCDLLDVTIEKGSYYYEIGDALDAMGEILDKPETKLSSDYVTKAVETLKRLPQRYQAAAQNLIPKINRAHG